MKSIITLAVTFFFALSLNAQNLTLTPGNQAKLNLPRLTYDQILAIPSPESGSIVYDLTKNCVRYYNGTKWLCTDQKTADFDPIALSAWKVSQLDPINNFQCNHIAVDNQGNSYITGSFSDNFRVNGVTYPPLGYGDVFVIKYNSSGAVQWVKTAGYPNSYSYSTDIEVDNQGNVFVGGNFFNGLTIDGNSVVANNSSGDVFLFKLSAGNGNFQALKAVGGSNYETLSEIFVDNQSNVYLIGNFLGNCNFGGISITGMDSDDIYIAKCNANLQFQWANKIVGVGLDSGRGICCDNAGNIYITGLIGSDANFTPDVKLAPGNSMMFVAKYNASNGNYIWHRNQVNAGSMSHGQRIAVDSEGNAYLAGYFFSYMDLGGGLQFNSASTASELFIAKISKDGVWQWAQKSYNSDYYGSQGFTDMRINAKDELFFLCGSSFGGTFGFADKRYLSYNSVFKFDKNGAVKGANIIQTGMNQHIRGVAFNGNYYYLMGYFNSSIAFGNISLSSATYNGFVAKFVE